MKSGLVAAELRKLADALDAQPDAEIIKPTVYFSHTYIGNGAKEYFLALAKLLPRPLLKGDGYSHDEIILEYVTEAMGVHASIAKSLTCELVEPAKPAVYRCDPILSDAAIEELR